MPKSRGPHFDELAFGTRSRHGKAILLQAVDVKLDGLANKLEHVLAGPEMAKNSFRMVLHLSLYSTRRAPFSLLWLTFTMTCAG